MYIFQLENEFFTWNVIANIKINWFPMSNLQNALIGMDIPVHSNQSVAAGYNISDTGSSDGIPLDDDYFEVGGHFLCFWDWIE